jgi:hypothetical protein
MRGVGLNRLGLLAAGTMLIGGGCKFGFNIDADVGGESDTRYASYCDLQLALETQEPELPAETTAEQDKPLIAEFARNEQVPLAEEALAELSGESGRIKRAAETFFGAYGKLAISGDPEVWANEEIFEASSVIHDFDLNHCGWGRTDVWATEFKYTGVPKEMDAGPVSFEFSNNGDEVHEIALYYLTPEATKPVEELMDLPAEDPEWLKSAVFVTAMEAEPGDFIYGIADLRPGRYAMVCFIPVGATAEVAEKARSSGESFDGEPHYKRGMIAEFEATDS